MSTQLRPPRHQVSRRAVTYWAVRAAAGWLIVVLVEVVALILATGYPPALVVTICVTVAVGALHVTVMPRWRYRVHRWEVTDEAVYTQAGWFNIERRIAPVRRIQTVDSERGPLEQLFGLTKVTITTASAAGPLKIHGLDAQTAAQLADQLTSETQAAAEDGT